MKDFIKKYSKLVAYLFVGHLLLIPIIQTLGGVINWINEDNWMVSSILSIVFWSLFLATGIIGISSFGSILSPPWRRRVSGSKFLRVFLVILSILIIVAAGLFSIRVNVIDLINGVAQKELDCYSEDRWVCYGTYYVLSCSGRNVEFNISKDLYYNINPRCKDGCLIRIDYVPGTHNVIGAETIEY